MEIDWVENGNMKAIAKSFVATCYGIQEVLFEELETESIRNEEIVAGIGLNIA